MAWTKALPSSFTSPKIYSTEGFLRSTDGRQFSALTISRIAFSGLQEERIKVALARSDPKSLHGGPISANWIANRWSELIQDLSVFGVLPTGKRSRTQNSHSMLDVPEQKVGHGKPIHSSGWTLLGTCGQLGSGAASEDAF